VRECPSFIGDFEFPAADVEQAVREGRLLSMEMEFSRTCNFRCPYCYVPRKSSPEQEMTPEKAQDVIRQARELGARKIIVLGGEPMIYPSIRDMVVFMRGKGLDIEIFTNGSKMTQDQARFLAEHEVKVVLKLNTRDPATQDLLAGREGAHGIIASALENLRKAGYPGPGKVLAISTVILKQNLDEILPLWTWVRDQGFEPYFERLTPQENARENDWLSVPEERVEEIFRAVSELDRTKYGKIWDPQPPLLANRCLRHQFSVLVNAYGSVFPCVGVTIPVGNVHERGLAEIIRDSEVLQDLRNYRQMIKGPCGTCDKITECYGCRGAAFQLTGDYLASDPLCWRNRARAEAIDHLPMDAAGLIPQKKPMRLVDTLVRVGERSAVAHVEVRENSPFVRRDGMLDDAAYIEILAQSMAAANGFRWRGVNGNGHKGLLLGARNLVVKGRARVGDQLVVSVFKEARLGDFGIIRGRVARNGDLLAEGEIKVWHDTSHSRPAPAPEPA
jgi:radical SAM protein with 4Fe4S-binding SPASM domain